MTSVLQRELKQQAPFASLEEEAFLALQVAAQRVLAPWALFLKSHAQLSPAQYNVLRILRGAHPEGLTSGSVAERLVSRDPDVTRLLNRLLRRQLVRRVRSESDRRVVWVSITDRGLRQLEELDAAVESMPRQLLSHLGDARLKRLNKLLGEVISGLSRVPRESQAARPRRRGG